MAPCKQSASKEEFLRAIGLNINDQGDKEKFDQLWRDATGYWCSHFETDNRVILKPEYAEQPAVRRPYKWAHLSPQYVDSVIRTIWTSTTSPTARHFYDQGAHADERVVNWVLKWLLWHVCRYRDWRNRKGRGSRVLSVNTNSRFGGGAAGSAGGGEYARYQLLHHPQALVLNHANNDVTTANESADLTRRADGQLTAFASATSRGGGGGGDDEDDKAGVCPRARRGDHVGGNVIYGNTAGTHHHQVRAPNITEKRKKEKPTESFAPRLKRLMH